MAIDPKTLAEWKHHWADEADAAYLYRHLAEAEPDPRRSDIYRRLADVEDRHAAMWQKLLRDNGVEMPPAKPSRKARIYAWLARRFGPSLLLSALLREEGQEVRGYMTMHLESEPGAAQDTALTLAQESAGHAETLRALAGSEGEPWHKTSSGGFLRNVVYGFNDGLTANFGLVAGVLGATTTGQFHLVAVTGVAGAVADALSMGSSGFLAAKSEQDVYAHEIAVEREEIRLMPELEEEELALIYEARGISAEQAKSMASDMMRSPERALEEKVREELKIGEAHTTPIREGWITGTATAVGAIIPVLPFVLLDGQAAIVTSFAAAMLSHFGVGAARSLFTGRGIVRSGMDMFLVGLGVAIVGYFVGDVIVRVLR